MDRFREIEAFVAVVEAGSFVKAGENLGISKAAVSRSVLDLEHRLGVRLLQRTTRRLSLTEAGRSYFDRGKHLLADLQEADFAVGGAGARPVGLLRVNAPYAFGVIQLAPLWGAFLERYPELRVEVTLSDRVPDMVDEDFDVSVRVARLEDATLVSRHLATSRMMLCASPDYLARRGSPAELADLQAHDLIGHVHTTPGNMVRMTGADGELEIPVHPRIFANSAQTCREVALSGAGITLQPDFVVGEDLTTGRLTAVLPQWRGPEFGIFAAYPARRRLSVKVRVLVDFLVEQFATPRW